MTATPQDFKNRKRKSITLPSGLVVEIKKIKMLDLVGPDELLTLAAERKAGATENADDQAAKVSEAVDAYERYGARIIVGGTVAPRFSADPAELDRDDVAHVDDLDDEDKVELIMQIMAWSGFTEEAGARAEQFRDDDQREASPRNGAGLQ